MSAYLVVVGTPKDPEKMAAYGQAVSPTLKAHGAEIIVAGPARVLIGDPSFARSAVIRFPDMAALDAWYNSPEYQEIVPIRDAAADLNFLTLED